MSDTKTYSFSQIIPFAVTSFALGFYIRPRLYSLLKFVPKDLSSVDMKLVLVVRSDLRMTKGKIAAQCSHAAVACYKEGLETHPLSVRQWERLGQPKIVLQVEGEQNLLNLKNKVHEAGLIGAIVRDAGRTQLRPGTITVLGIGPDLPSKIDKITSSLKLL